MRRREVLEQPEFLADMPYNYGMAHLSLVLPFALPVPEFAPELVRALQAPALAMLLSRTSAHARTPLDDGARALPHEQWLAHALGLVHEGKPAFAAAAMRGYALSPAEGTWFIINPSHIQIARSHLMMADLRLLDLSEDDGRALFDAAAPLFEEAGHALSYGDAQTWFMRADEWAGIDTATPDCAVGMDLTDWMPTGARAIAYRKLQNDVQMVWYTHPANAAREERGLPAVNAFWPWGASTTAAPAARPLLATFDTPGWLAALGGRKLDSPADLAGSIAGNTILVCGNAAAPAIAADWSGWLQQMQRLESALFAPLRAALMQGRVGELRLVLSHRGALAEFTTTAMAQRKFWRRPTLDRLL